MPVFSIPDSVLKDQEVAKKLNDFVLRYILICTCVYICMLPHKVSVFCSQSSQDYVRRPSEPESERQLFP